MTARCLNGTDADAYYHNYLQKGIVNIEETIRMYREHGRFKRFKKYRRSIGYGQHIETDKQRVMKKMYFVCIIGHR